MALNTFILLCNLHNHPSPALLHLRQLKLYAHQTLPISSLSLVTTILLSAPLNLTCLDTSSFVKYLSLRDWFVSLSIMSSCCCKWKNFLHFYGWIICLIIFFLIEVSLIYNIVLVSDIQQSDFVIHIYIYSVFQFSIIVYTWCWI